MSRREKHKTVEANKFANDEKYEKSDETAGGSNRRVLYESPRGENDTVYDEKNKRYSGTSNNKYEDVSGVNEKEYGAGKDPDSLAADKNKDGFFSKLEERIEARAEKNKNKPPKYGNALFEVSGLNFARLINAMNREAPLKKVKAEGRVLSFSVKAAHCGKIIAILERLCYDYKIIKVYGAAPFAASFFKRTGALCGLACIAAALFVYPCFVTRIEVSGDNVQGVYEVLESYGLTEGAFLPSLDDAAIENSLLALKNVAFASVTKNGTHVYVTIKPEQALYDFVDVGGKTVTAKRLASVTRVVVYGGTAEVKYGDVVKPGDTLIADYVLVGEEKVPAAATGAVYGKIYYEKTLFFADTLKVKEYGESVTFSKLSLLGSTPKTPDAPYKLYELKTNIVKNGFLLPFSRYTWIYTEIKYTEKENTFSEEEMIERTRSSLLTQTGAEAVVLACYSTVTRARDGYNVKVVIETEERID